MIFRKLIPALSLLVSVPGFAIGGADVGNGGDGYSLEFVSFGQSLLLHWNDLGLSSSLKVSKEDFTDAIARAHVYSATDPLFMGDTQVDAKNYPFCKDTPSNPSTPCGEILVNRPRWDAMIENPIRKMALVLHEYLGVLGVGGQRFDDFYQVTSKTLDPIRMILSKQSRVDVNFSCSISGWDPQMGQEYVINTVDTYGNPAPRVGLNVTPNDDTSFDFWIELNVLPGDLLAPTLTNQLSYLLYRAHPLRIPSKDDLIASGPVEFKESGKRSLRIHNGPDLQLTCFRTFDGVSGRSL